MIQSVLTGDFIDFLHHLLQAGTLFSYEYIDPEYQKSLKALPEIGMWWDHNFRL
ncbi:hypothetical protein J3L18_09905 [Mucilaginibacter gossypii]|uniref:hypothetical protein n=1 Tax=Mucilaginibacter gossypii TaxID=551996 RepID=UPI00167B65D0|nr:MULTISPECIES: hypothetical protein [Mucilaginibacter]QTE39344.1 hypothetical protein J3L18_09905 [Mucilaginibacter gossypii]